MWDTYKLSRLIYCDWNVSQIGFENLEDHAIPPTTTEALLYLSLQHQLVELRKENIELRKWMTNDQHYKDNYVRKPEKPEIKLDSSDGDWALFMDTWNRYKEMCKLTNPSTICNELRMVCTPELNRLLFNLMGAESLNTASEDQLLQYIMLVTAKRFHKEVHQQNFHSMKQKEGESITHFLARLQTLAKFCEFTVTCPNKPDYG